jgi:hypothetical protein
MKMRLSFYSLIFSLCISPMGAQAAPKQGARGDPREFMAAICDSPVELHQQYSTLFKSSQTFCSVCPEFTHGGGVSLYFDGAYPGHFSKNQVHEALVIAEGCNPEATAGGGVHLLRREKGHWKRLSTLNTPLHPKDCALISVPEGRDTVVCDYAPLHQGTYNSTLTLYSVEGDSITPHAIILPVGLLGANDADGQAKHGYCYSITPETYAMTFSGNQYVLQIQIGAERERAKRDADNDCSDVVPKTLFQRLITLNFVLQGNDYHLTDDSQPALDELTHFLD